MRLSSAVAGAFIPVSLADRDGSAVALSSLLFAFEASPFGPREAACSTSTASPTACTPTAPATNDSNPDKDHDDRIASQPTSPVDPLT
jgi:hypothetical protein